ncbi:hypothetical protein C5167_030125 [Papaver somniferum]|uniref:uncharacterized protein LOC113330107 isoform X1 n=1 Tax=Papaver somniferum TaxID=3469 RepID=UPI000E6FD804|nr:uncharacterized protein LOC113330107 isoform X1 [Papaver somniferum]RZC86771.1 hypothetical protein C5167_030125 [Papaver somniferum]
MAGMENHRHTRTNIKSNQNNWKQKLREKCLKRIQEDRNHLLWKMRLPSSSSSSETTPSVNQKNIIDPTFRDIVSEELKKMKDSSSDNCTRDTLTSDDAMLDDAIWEYDGNCTTKATESECEEIMIEMQRIFYDDLRVQQSRTDIAEQAECIRTWEEEEDNYLAQAVFERLQLSNDQVRERVIWCPICKKGELQENSDLIDCNRCKFRLVRVAEVDLEYLRLRLAEAHSEHLDRGCRMTPKFCMETRFNLTALYIQCQSCNTFEIVI